MNLARARQWVRTFWRRYRSRLRVMLDLGFAGFSTDLMEYAMERDVFTYARITWHLFGWSGDFDLFAPSEQIVRWTR